ncbi:MAG: hypothetical protein H8D78_00845 [Chloroflexi bacterium]|nr:hypothetical protein [Chloroflexota bacterium]
MSFAMATLPLSDWRTPVRSSPVSRVELLGGDYEGTLWEPLDPEQIVGGYSWITFECPCEEATITLTPQMGCVRCTCGRVFSYEPVVMVEEAGKHG